MGQCGLYFRGPMCVICEKLMIQGDGQKARLLCGHWCHDECYLKTDRKRDSPNPCVLCKTRDKIKLKEYKIGMMHHWDIECGLCLDSIDYLPRKFNCGHYMHLCCVGGVKKCPYCLEENPYLYILTGVKKVQQCFSNSNDQ